MSAGQHPETTGSAPYRCGLSADGPDSGDLVQRILDALARPQWLRQDDAVLTIEGPISDYVIEPARHDLGLSRVEMVDAHLADLVRNGRSPAPDCYGNSDYDALLEARSYFTEESR